MNPRVRHIDLHADEFLAAISGELSPAELGVYWLICLLCYSRGGAIKNDLGWLRAKFRPGKGNRVVGEILDSLIERGKVFRDGDEIGVRRALDEVEIALRRIRDASESGHRGGRPRKKNNGIEKPSPLNGEKPTTNHQPPITIEDDANASSGTHEGASNGRSSGRGTRIPADWQPRPEDYEWALAEHGVGREWADKITAEYLDYWLDQPGDRGRKVCWWRTWRNRIRAVAGDSRSRPANGPGGSGSGHSRIAAALDRVHLAPDISGPH